MNSTIALPAIYKSLYSLSASKCKAGTIEYTTKYGESPWTISNRNATLLDGLMWSNPWMCPPLTPEGSTICIPEALYMDYTLFSIKDVSGCQYYHTKANDSFYSLQNGATVAKRLTTLDAANPVYGQDVFPAGTILCVPTYCMQKKYPFNITLPFPATAPEHPNCTYYHTKSGDSIALLSKGDQTLMDALMLENALQNSTVTAQFPMGKILCLPRDKVSQYSLYAQTPLSSSQCGAKYTNGLDFYRLSVSIGGGPINGNGTIIAQLLAANPNVGYYYGGSYASGVCMPK